MVGGGARPSPPEPSLLHLSSLSQAPAHPPVLMRSSPVALGSFLPADLARGACPDPEWQTLGTSAADRGGDERPARTFLQAAGLVQLQPSSLRDEMAGIERVAVFVERSQRASRGRPVEVRMLGSGPGPHVFWIWLCLFSPSPHILSRAFVVTFSKATRCACPQPTKNPSTATPTRVHRRPRTASCPQQPTSRATPIR